MSVNYKLLRYIHVITRLGVLSLLLALSVTALAQKDSVAVCPYRFSVVDRTNFEKGVAAYNEKHYTECATLLRKVSAKNPKAADPYFYLGMTAAKQDNNPAAIRRYFTKLAAVCPDYPNALAHFYMGVVNYTDEHYEAAIGNFNRYFDIANRQSTPEYVAVYEEASNYLYWSQFLSEAMLNPVPFSPQVVRGASSRYDELLPFITWDGRQIYYLRQVSQRKERTFYAKMNEQLEPRLCVSRWRDTVFSSGEELPAPFNQGAVEGGVSLTADNNTLYYSILTTEGGVSNFDIYYSQFRDGAWQPIQNAGSNVNTPKAWDSQPSISPDAQLLYFASNRPGGLGGTDIWVCHRLPNGDWSRAENLGPSVNTAGNEKCPFLHADGHTLYFASNGWQGFGGYDMYFIDLRDTYMQRPTNMGMPLNNENDDICFGVIADGTQGYFANKSTTYTGVGGTDIFRFELYPDARPDPMRIVPVRVTTASGQPGKTTINVKHYASNGTEYPESSYLLDFSQHNTAIALSKTENNLVVATANGYMPAPKLLPKNISSDTLRFTLFPIKEGDRYPLPASLYDLRTSQLTSAARQLLDVYVSVLQENPRLHIRIESPVAAEAQAIYAYMLSCKLRVERLEQRVNTSIATASIVITSAPLSSSVQTKQ